MRDPASPERDSQQRALWALLRAIAARDRRLALRLLEESRALALSRIEEGAARATGEACFLAEIAHSIYTGDTPLHVAAAAYQLEVAAELISIGAGVRAGNRFGAEPIHYAADGVPGSAGWDPVAQSSALVLLIEAGADPNAENKNGVTPLHRAVRTRCAAAVRTLLTHGADARRMNGSGSTALHLAVQSTGRGGSGSAAAREQQTEIIRLLLDHGARSSDRDSAGRSVDDRVRAGWIRTLLGEA